MRKLVGVLAMAGAACVWSAGAAAQAKIAWSDSCGKADPEYTVQSGDPGSHSFGLAQLKCHATKPAEIGGDKGKEAVVTYVTNSSGDKVSLPFQGTIALKDGKPTGAHAHGALVTGLESSRG